MRPSDFFKARLIKLLGIKQSPSFPGVNISPTASVQLNKATDTIGEGSRIGAYCELSSTSGGALDIGKRCDIGRAALLLTYGGTIQIGDDCSINPYSVIYGHGGLKIGNHVRIATHTVIIPANHNFDRFDAPICRQGLSMRGIVIDDDVWIGAHVVITDGVRIGTGAVIGAGAVVTSNVEPHAVYGGVPARILKRRVNSCDLADELGKATHDQKTVY
ncbi:MAG: acyltransferase [Betaproteobacteria bacterium HGW-Betaproteobacteria-7]|jgi:acetyltransferase-like isoleucine patch superfamily enzyme|nr:MAG: acyltransferase [Betaproteobacteria bacterium HGW-Betaproteobacteria-7]